MLYLKEANFQDIEQEYIFLSKMPSANGFENPYINVTRETINDVIQ